MGIPGRSSLLVGCGFLLAGALGAEEVVPVEAGAGFGVVVGRVVAAQDAPVADAKVTLVDLRRQTRSDQAGAFRFENVPPGLYILQADSARAGMSVARVEVRAEQETSVELALDLATHQETVVVTARGDAATLNELASPVDVLAGQELQEAREATLGETLARHPASARPTSGPAPAAR